ncbi:hypothetical protein [Alcaligenes phenolicus]|uniref:hypothetical protein n=1 Tax=Alcaligenes phenolicus TaxID=232846 RepID=UPI002BDA3F15|nr:hypothetical protein [Alcaligenes phenolicus]HRO20807.1 hypothetical protein [Alcaligenes phenolicus]HRP13639.1 hypothetical protein [Alcaligenes phenolicus]
MAWYDAGTVKVTVNSATVTGTGTKWLAGARQGEAFVAPDGRLYEVLNIASDTSLTLTKPYRGATATGQPYALAPMQGYVKELADRAAELLPALSDIGTAAKGTLTTSTIDPVAGRVMRNADWGFGGANGVAADQNILNNTVNGIYRSGSSDEGKPDAHTAGSYFRMGWGTTYYGLLYNSPITDKWHVRTVRDGAANSWKELMTVGQYGVGRSGADANLDVFPAAKLDDLNVGSGAYYYNEAIGSVSGLPFDNVAGYNAGVVFHRQAGTAGGQVVVSSSNRLGWRGRRAGAYHTWREAMYVGEYGFGGAQASPTSWDAQKTGWYYKSGAKPAWGGGGFFLDLAYNTTHFNSGLRISTDPYTDNFYMNGAVSGQKTFRDACKLVHDKNIVGDVAAGSVIATGSNANGTWVRFADGTQLCYGTFGFSGNGWKPTSPAIYYPLGFISQPSVSIQTTNDGSAYYTAAQVAMGPGLSAFHIRTSVTIPDSGTSLGGSYIAIGRYK